MSWVVDHYRTMTAVSQPVQVDPSAPGTVIRYLMAFEGTMNILAGIPILLAPAAVLSYLVEAPSEISELSKSLTQCLGAMIVGITPQLFLAYDFPP
jgi:hypothetical protein